MANRSSAKRPRSDRARARINPGDLVAGLSVAPVLVPQSLAYAQLAGMPAYRGLYAAALPPIAAALFASSPYLQTGPVALTALLTFGALSAQAPPGSDEYVALGVLLALVVGITRLAIGLLRAGVVAYLCRAPMLLGFLPAAAILIVASQLPAALGVTPTEDGILGGRRRARAPRPVVLGRDCLCRCYGASSSAEDRDLHRLFPGVLVAVGLGLVVGLARLLRRRGRRDSERTRRPCRSIFPGRSSRRCSAPGVIIALVGFVEASSIARTFAAQERRRWDSDREFVGQGASNVASALAGGFPVGGSFSRSALNRSAGAQTRWSGAVTGLVVLAFIPFASVLSSLPKAVLAGIVIAAVVPLTSPRPSSDWRGIHGPSSPSA